MQLKPLPIPETELPHDWLSGQVFNIALAFPVHAARRILEDFTEEQVRELYGSIFEASMQSTKEFENYLATLVELDINKSSTFSRLVEKLGAAEAVYAIILLKEAAAMDFENALLAYYWMKWHREITNAKDQNRESLETAMKIHESIQKHFRRIRANEIVKSRWKKRDLLIEKAKERAKESWLNGDHRLHNKMAEDILNEEVGENDRMTFADYKIKIPAMRKAMKDLAKELGREDLIRGISNLKKNKEITPT